MAGFSDRYESYWEADLIIDGVYLGSFDSAAHTEGYAEHGITHLLSLLGNTEIEILDKQLGDHKVKRKHIHILDVVGVKMNMVEALPEATAFMREAVEKGGACLVHCWQGVSRSSSCVVAYLMRYEGMTLNEAYNKVRSRRTIARPNPTFFDALVVWEKMIKQGKVPKRAGVVREKKTCVMC